MSFFLHYKTRWPSKAADLVVHLQLSLRSLCFCESNFELSSGFTSVIYPEVVSGFTPFWYELNYGPGPKPKLLSNCLKNRNKYVSHFVPEEPWSSG